MKIRQLGAEFFHTDGRTDMTKLTVAFHNFAKTAQKPCHSMEDHPIKNSETASMNLTVTPNWWRQTNQALHRPNCNQALSVANKNSHYVRSTFP